MAVDLERSPIDDDADVVSGDIEDGYQPPLDEGPGPKVFHRVEHRQGPMPDSQELMGYKYVDASLPMAILEMAQKEQQHRHEMDKLELTESVSAAKRGQSLGAGIALSVLILAGVLALMGQPVLAGIMAGIDVVGLAAVFVGTHIAQKNAS